MSFETVEWETVGDDETVLVDSVHETEARRYGTDSNGAMWLQSPGHWTRGPMRPDRVVVQTQGESR